MKETIIKLVNRWYKDFEKHLIADDLISELIKVIDEQTNEVHMAETFEEWQPLTNRDFEKILALEFPQYTFALVHNEWIIINEIKST